MFRSDTDAFGDHAEGVTQPGGLNQLLSSRGIGKLKALTGSVTITRADAILTRPIVGDPVYEGDLIETGDDGQVAIVFLDGTAIRLDASASMVLNEFACDAEGSPSSALFHVAKGVFAFLAGKLATTGRLIIDTPLGQIQGMRSAAGIGSLAFGFLAVAMIDELKAGTLDFGLLDDETIDYNDLKHGFFVVHTFGDNPEDVTVGDVTKSILIRLRGTTISVEQFTNSPAVMAFLEDQYKLAHDAHERGLQDPFIQQLLRGPNDRADATPQNLGTGQSEGIVIPASFSSTTVFSSGTQLDSGSPSTSFSFTHTDTGNTNNFVQNFQTTNDIFFTNSTPRVNDNNTGTPSFVPPSEPPPSQPPSSTSGTTTASSNTFIWPSGTGTWDTPPSWDVGSVPTTSAATVEIQSGMVTYNDTYTISNLFVDPGATLDIVSGSLTVLNGVDDGGTIVVDGDPPLLIINGPTTVDSTGKIVASGAGSTVDFTGNVFNFGVIAAKQGGTVSFTDDTVTNEPGSTSKIVSRGNGSAVDFTNDIVDNYAIIAARHHGAVSFDKSTVDNYDVIVANHDGKVSFDNSTVDNYDVIVAKHDGKVSFDKSTVDNYDVIVAKHDGTVLFDDTKITNKDDGVIEAKDRGTVKFDDAKVTNDNGGRIVSIGRGSLVDFWDGSVSNDGTIVAKDDGTVRFDDTTVNNKDDGVIEAKDHGTVKFDDTSVTNKHDGVIEAKDHGTVKFDDAKVTNDNGGAIVAIGRGSLVDFRDGSVSNDGTIVAKDDGTVRFDDTAVTNKDDGVIEAKDRGAVKFDDTKVTNDDDGRIVSIGCGSLVDFQDSRVTNYGTIVAKYDGAVLFDDTWVTNKDDGVIEAKDRGTVRFDHATVTNDNDSRIVSIGHGSLVDFQDSWVDNQGTIQAKDGGAVWIDDSVIFNVCGIIDAIGRGATVDLDRAVIVGGTVETKWGGLIQTVYGNSTFYDVTVACGSDVLVNWGTTLTLDDGTTIIGSTLSVDRHGTVDIEDRATLDDVTVHNSGTIQVDYDSHTTTLTLDDGTTITGGTLSIGRHGTVDIEGSATLDDVTVSNSGKIQVDDSTPTKTTLTLDDGTTITGGTLSIGRHGTVDIEDRATLDDVTVSNSGTIQVDYDSHTTTLTLDDGTTITGGTLSIGRHGTVDIEDRATLDDVTVDNSGTIQVDYDSHTTTLTLDDGTTITGGTLSIGRHGTVDIEDRATLDDVTVDNSGTIQVDYDSYTTLTLDDGTTITGGTLSIGRHGTVDIEDRATLDDVTVDNSGIIQVDEPHSTTTTLTLDDGTKVSGGKLSIGKSGKVDIEGKATLDDVTVSNTGKIQVDDPHSTTTTLILDDGTMISGGMLSIGSSGAVDIEGSATLDDVTVSNSGTIQVDEPHLTTTTLTLDDGTKITGGKLSVGSSGTVDVEGSATLDDVTVSNSGTIDVDLTSTTTLTLDDGTKITGGKLSVGSSGTVDVEGSATLDDVTVSNSGTIDVDLTSTTTLTLDDGTKITGGKLSVGSSGTVDVEGSATLDDVTVSNSGTIDVDLTSTTTLTLDDGTKITGGKLSVGNSGTVDVEGSATLDDVTVSNSGTIKVDGSTLTVDKNSSVTGSGKVVITNGGVADFADAFNENVVFSGAGTLELAYTYSGTVTGFGTNDVLDLTNLTDPTNETVKWTQIDSTHGTLTIYDGSTVVETITLDGTYTQTDFALTKDGGNGTDVVYATTDDWSNSHNGNGSNGNWIDGSSWSNGAPTSTMNAVLDYSNAYTVTISGTVDANSLTIDDTKATLQGYGTLSIATIVNDGTIDVSTQKTLTITGNVSGTGSIDIENKATVILDGSNTNTVYFQNGNGTSGTLEIHDASTFTGKIGNLGIHDTLDLDGFDWHHTTAKTGTGSYNTSTNTTTLTVTDTSGHSASLTLIGNYSTSSWTVSNDGHGGVDIVDPPATDTSTTDTSTFTDTSTVSSASTDVSGVFAFTDNNSSHTDTASYTSANNGTNYIGTFSVDTVKSNGISSVDWEFKFDNDQINLAPGQTVTQSYDIAVSNGSNSLTHQTVSVSIGGPGNDNFVFNPGVGNDTIANYHPGDTIDLDNFNIHSYDDLDKHITTDSHGNAVIDLGHNDSITIAGVSATDLHNNLTSIVHLH